MYALFHGSDAWSVVQVHQSLFASREEAAKFAVQKRNGSKDPMFTVWYTVDEKGMLADYNGREALPDHMDASWKFLHGTIVAQMQRLTSPAKEKSAVDNLARFPTRYA